MLDQELVGLLMDCNELSLEATRAFEEGSISPEEVCRLAHRVAAIRSLVLSASVPPGLPLAAPTPSPAAPAPHPDLGRLLRLVA